MQNPRLIPPLPSRRALLLTGMLAILSGCATRPGQPGDSVTSGRLNNRESKEIALHASRLLGTPYRYGGTNPESGFDCSGLIGYVYRQSAGLTLPRTVAQLSKVGSLVEREKMRPGDLVFFRVGGSVSHAGIFIGDQRFIHAPSTGGVVRTDPLESGYWKPRFAGIRRI